jgi:hypothetical protein
VWNISLFSYNILPMKDLILYLSGPIDKKSGKFNQDFLLLQKELVKIGITCLSPEIRSDDVSNSRGVFLRDMFQSVIADVIVVDARESCGLGVGSEAAMSFCAGGQAIFITPPNSHYRRDEVNLLGTIVHNWVHPFVLGLSSTHFLDSPHFEEVSKALKALPRKSASWTTLLTPPMVTFGVSYVTEHLPSDNIMLLEISKNPRMEEVVAYFKAVAKG